MEAHPDAKNLLVIESPIHPPSTLSRVEIQSYSLISQPFLLKAHKPEYVPIQVGCLLLPSSRNLSYALDRVAKPCERCRLEPEERAQPHARKRVQAHALIGFVRFVKKAAIGHRGSFTPIARARKLHQWPLVGVPPSSWDNPESV
ncbi:hypothetical protein VNO77_27809 [Canavalia gladiata]|uniref:Uncharacterized protein n=1 Tax=Canavalia gladiata TaxID=3824 RepID=A0AAN9KXK3_CANGL